MSDFRKKLLQFRDVDKNEFDQDLNAKLEQIFNKEDPEEVTEKNLFLKLKYVTEIAKILEIWLYFALNWTTFQWKFDYFCLQFD